MISVIISLNILVMHVTKSIFFFLRQTRNADYYHRIITIGIGMLGTTFWIEIVMTIKKSSVFIERTRDNTYINFSFLNATMLEMNLKFNKLRPSFRS